MKRRRINWDHQPLGEIPDTQIARKLGVNPGVVGAARNARGIPVVVPTYTPPNPLAGGVRAARKKAGLTLAQLAARAGTAAQTIGCAERGVYEPRFSTLIAIADALDVSLDVLVGRKRKKAT